MSHTDRPSGTGRGVLRRKPIELVSDVETGDEGLERTLGLLQLTAIGVGGIIGAGSSP